MEKEDRKKKAMDLFASGYNCSQSVFAAFSDLYDIDRETALKLSTPFGGGFAGTRDICGAVSALAMVVGLDSGTAKPNDKEGKLRSYSLVNQLVDEFEKEHGTILCKYLLGLDESTTPIKQKECCEYIGYCAQLIENKLLKSREE